MSAECPADAHLDHWSLWTLDFGPSLTAFMVAIIQKRGLRDFDWLLAFTGDRHRLFWHDADSQCAAH